MVEGLVLVEAVPNPFVELVRPLGVGRGCASCCAGSGSTCWRNCRRTPGCRAGDRSACLAWPDRGRPERPSLRARSGVVPAMSIDTRRRKVASSARGDGGMPSTFSLPKTAWSIRFRSGGSVADAGAQRNRGTKRRDLPLVAGHHGDLASQVERLDEARRRHFGHFGVVRLEQGHPRDVFGRAVAVAGHDSDLLLGASFHHPSRLADTRF